MITELEWNLIAKKAFPPHDVKAPPFLWTRILAAIQTEETRRSSVWWLQWRWMSRVAVSASLLVSVGAYCLLQNATVPLEDALDGLSNQHEAIQIATTHTSNADESAALFIGID